MGGCALNLTVDIRLSSTESLGEKRKLRAAGRVSTIIARRGVLRPSNHVMVPRSQVPFRARKKKWTITYAQGVRIVYRLLMLSLHNINPVARSARALAGRYNYKYRAIEAIVG